MTLIKIVSGALLAAAAGSVLAQDDGATGNSAVSKVAAVYVREARGLYYEKALLRRAEDKALWVEVRFADALTGGVKSELFLVPAGVAIERGDLVVTRAGDESPRNLNLLPDVSRVTRLVAKHDTLMAMAFGLSNSTQLPGLYAQSQACWVPTQVADAGEFLK
jgi:hypothetical protein